MEGAYILMFIVGGVLGFLGSQMLRERLAGQKIKDAEEKASMIIDSAERKADSLVKEAQLEAKDRLFKMKSDFDAETADSRAELKKQERRLQQKEENLDKKNEQIQQQEQEVERRQKDLQKRDADLQSKEKQYNEIIEQQRKQLEEISGLTSEGAKELLLQSMENEARHEGAKLVKRITSEAKENADKEAKKIMASAIQRYAGDFVAERTVSVVQLPDDEMKGRIIGREGRNIRALEAATGIDLIIDDTPEAVILSGFNPVRREVARIALTRLIEDGRIHPARIEDMVQKVNQEVETTIKEAGDQAAFDLGVHGISNELIRYLGRLKYRTSYAQNMLQHSVEVGFLCGAMASELG
ncbi:MAG TPA: ribonuclease Y, partial [Desulfosalsimonadaceae bacterium]|nr:ribonuclease Y [Desulfosalsimonadaceae bacterium]